MPHLKRHIFDVKHYAIFNFLSCYIRFAVKQCCLMHGISGRFCLHQAECSCSFVSSRISRHQMFYPAAKCFMIFAGNLYSYTFPAFKIGCLLSWAEEKRLIPVAKTEQGKSGKLSDISNHCRLIMKSRLLIGNWQNLNLVKMICLLKSVLSRLILLMPKLVSAMLWQMANLVFRALTLPVLSEKQERQSTKQKLSGARVGLLINIEQPLTIHISIDLCC